MLILRSYLYMDGNRAHRRQAGHLIVLVFEIGE